MFRSALDWCLPFWGLDPTTESEEIHLPRAESVAVFLTAVVCLPDLDPGRALAAGYQPTKPPLPAKRRIGRASTASHCFPLQRLLVAERRVSGFQPLRRRWRRRRSSLGRTSEATSKTKQGVDLQIFGSRSNAGVYMQNDLGQCVTIRIATVIRDPNEGSIWKNMRGNMQMFGSRLLIAIQIRGLFANIPGGGVTLTHPARSAAGGSIHSVLPCVRSNTSNTSFGSSYPLTRGRRAVPTDTLLRVGCAGGLRPAGRLAPLQKSSQLNLQLSMYVVS